MRIRDQCRFTQLVSLWFIFHVFKNFWMHNGGSINNLTYSTHKTSKQRNKDYCERWTATSSLKNMVQCKIQQITFKFYDKIIKKKEGLKGEFKEWRNIFYFILIFPPLPSGLAVSQIVLCIMKENTNRSWLA